jgi:DNA repair protein RadC
MRCKQTTMFRQLQRNTVKIVQLKMVCEDTGLYSKMITCCKDVVDLVRPLFDGAYCEKVVVLCLNNHNCPTSVSVVNIGGLTQAMVSPGNVFKLALLSNASSIILVHNHPGGSLSPSIADREITEAIKKGGKLLELELLDHVIIAGPNCEQYYSFKDHALL